MDAQNYYDMLISFCKIQYGGLWNNLLKNCYLWFFLLVDFEAVIDFSHIQYVELVFMFIYFKIDLFEW